MFNNFIYRFTVILTSVVFFISCSKEKDFKPLPYPQNQQLYNNGFFILTEGSYGQTSGTVHYYGYGADTLVKSAYEKENPGKGLSNAAKTSTVQFATMYANKIFITNKLNGPIVRLNATTLKEEVRYNQESSNWRSIIGIEGAEGLISANDGVYVINLNTLIPTYKLSSVSAVNTGDMLKVGNYIYILQSNGAKIITANNYSFVKSFKNITRGFAVTPNGKVWASTGTALISIDKNLDTTGVSLPVSIGAFGLDAPTRITASTKENAVFYHSGNTIYKYKDGDVNSLNTPFITIDINPFMTYGAIRYDAHKDYIVVNGIAGYGAASGINYLLLYNASTGALVKKVQYGNDGSVVNFNDIYFPGLAVFY